MPRHFSIVVEVKEESRQSPGQRRPRGASAEPHGARAAPEPAPKPPQRRADGAPLQRPSAWLRGARGAHEGAPASGATAPGGAQVARMSGARRARIGCHSSLGHLRHRLDAEFGSLAPTSMSVAIHRLDSSLLWPHLAPLMLASRARDQAHEFVAIHTKIEAPVVYIALP